VSPAKLPTRPADRAWAGGRCRVGEKYLEVAGVASAQDGAAINVCVGLCVLAGIAAADAICAVALGERYSGQDHTAAATLLGRVDSELGNRLRALVALKPGSHYGNALLTTAQRDAAVRASEALIEEARKRTS
jgi:hypothetical protein